MQSLASTSTPSCTRCASSSHTSSLFSRARILWIKCSIDYTRGLAVCTHVSSCLAPHPSHFTKFCLSSTLSICFNSDDISIQNLDSHVDYAFIRWHNTKHTFPIFIFELLKYAGYFQAEFPCNIRTDAHSCNHACDIMIANYLVNFYVRAGCFHAESRKCTKSVRPYSNSQGMPYTHV